MKIAVVILMLVSSAMPQTMGDEILGNLIAVQRIMELKDSVIVEYTDMALELSKLGDPQVAAILTPHVTKVKKAMKEIQNIQREASEGPDHD